MSGHMNLYKYISEGNAHIVLEIVNTDKVLRLLKHEKDVSCGAIELAINFVNVVMTPLLSNDIVKYDIIEITEENVYSIIRHIQPVRPKERIGVSKVFNYGVIAPNLLVLSSKCDNYCIEIKPKEGFMSTQFKEFSKCYYCMKQLLKLEMNQILTLSQYCPLDLFSGDKQRMRYALWNLIQNPQNNFKLFHNDEIIYSNKNYVQDLYTIISHIEPFKKSKGIFIDFIIEVLLSGKNGRTEISSDTDITQQVRQPNRTYCLNSNIDNLPNDCMLHKLLKLQKITENINLSCECININGDIEYVNSILDKVGNFNLHDKRQVDEFLTSINDKHKGLIAAVAKDSSLMISFSLNPVEGYPFIVVGDHKISYRIAPTDLEPKPEKTLVKRKKTEEKIIQLYKQLIENIEENKIQLHTETKTKQMEAWQHLIIDYLKATKQSTIDIRESQNSPLFNNVSINRKLSQEAVLTILEDMAKTGKAAPIDKSKNVWEVYWHSLDEWGNMVYNWACNNGLNNTVCTLFELREGENTVDEEFHGLDMNVLVKALKALQTKGKCELMEFDDSQGVKFF